MGPKAPGPSGFGTRGPANPDPDGRLQDRSAGSPSAPTDGWWAGEGCIGESADGWRREVLILGESYGFKALHFENQEPQMNPYERRYLVNGEANWSKI